MGNLHKCPTCEGTGEIRYRVEEWSENPSIVEQSSPCFDCRASGYVNTETLKKIKYEENMWCECEEQNDDAYYVPDNEHEFVKKHHWRCSECKKVVQIG